jgi:uncharacterized membrane protein
MQIKIREWPIIGLVLLPFIYLAMIYGQLPEEVPLHWNINGEIDRWGPKKQLWMIPFLLPCLSYLIFLVVPYIDPKKKIKKMGAKYQQLKFIFVLFMTLLALLIIYATENQTELAFIHLIIMLIGLFLALLGNYFQSLKPNYFIGVRTPWTLESEDNWAETHKLAGKLWFAGGILIILISLIFHHHQSVVSTLFFIILAILILVPIIYSYLLYKRE